jgi:hypothetical protein
MKLTEFAVRSVTEPGWADLEPCLGRPARPRLGATLEATKGMSPAAAWGAPLEHRSFVDSVAPPPGSVEPSLRLRWGTRRLLPSPPTLGAAVALLADLDGVAAAERLAAEVFRRMVPLGTRVPTRTVWLVEMEPRILDLHGSQPFRPRLDDLLRLDEARLSQGEMSIWMPHRPPDHGSYPWRRAAKRDLIRANAWESGSEWRAPDGTALSSPLEPLMGIWRLGYALSAATDDVVLLSAEEVPIERDQAIG